MNKRETKAFLARILRMELCAICKFYFENEADSPSLPAITSRQIGYIDEVSEKLSDEEYVLLNTLFRQLKKHKKLRGEEQRNSARALIYQYMNMVYLEYYQEMGTPKDYFLLMDKRIIHLYNQLVCRGKRMKMDNRAYDVEGKLLYEIRDTHIQAFTPEGEKLVDTVTDKQGNVQGWKKTRDYTGGFCDGMRQGQGIEYYDAAACSGIRREGLWEQGEFISGKEYGVLVYRTGEIPEEDDFDSQKDMDKIVIKQDFEGNVLHKDLDYVWDVIMGEGESARYYFADVELEDGEYSIIPETVRAAIERM